jgi:hypothetical protein
MMNGESFVVEASSHEPDQICVYFDDVHPRHFFLLQYALEDTPQAQPMDQHGPFHVLDERLGIHALGGRIGHDGPVPLVQ